jgi:hypothetical protein
MLWRAIRFISFLAIAHFLTTTALALPRQAQVPPAALTNADVIKMVRAGLPESTIVAAIGASPTSFDISPDGLIAVKSAGVAQAVMEAMITAESNKRTAGSRVSTGLPNVGGAAESGAPVPGPLHVDLLPTAPAPGTAASAVAFHMTAERTQLAETTTKVKSLGGLVGDGALNDGLQSGVNLATWEGMSRTGSIAGMGVSEAGNVVGSLLSRRDSSLTYVWAVPGTNSANVSVPSRGATFGVSFSGLSGVNPDEYEPVLVKLTSTFNDWRLVGASQGKQSARSSSALDWQVYAGFVEDRVPAQSRKLGSGEYQLSPTGTLAPGEYGVVLRPLSKSKKFSGSDIAGNVGDGLIFNSVWAFEIR